MSRIYDSPLMRMHIYSRLATTAALTIAGCAAVRPSNAIAQERSVQLLALSRSRADSSQVLALLRGGDETFIPVLTGPDGTQVYVALEGVVDEGQGRQRAWFVFIHPFGRADAGRVRLDCRSGAIVLLGGRGPTNGPTEISGPASFGQALCRIVERTALTRDSDQDGNRLRARRNADSVRYHSQRWRRVADGGTLEIAPASRKDTPEGREAWTRYANQSGGSTVALLEVKCGAEQHRIVQATATDANGETTNVVNPPGIPFRRVAPESAEERQLRAICGNQALEVWNPDMVEALPPSLLSNAPKGEPGVTVQLLFAKPLPDWVNALLQKP